MPDPEDMDDFERLFDSIAAAMGVSLFTPADLGGSGYFEIVTDNGAGAPVSRPMQGGERKCDVKSCRRQGSFYPIGQTRYGLSLCKSHFKRYRDSAYRKIIEK